MTSRRIVPLQSHGVYEKVWVPPKEKFVTYEPSDEPWLRYFGIGREENRLAELYDIRTYLNGKPALVGYTKFSPEGRAAAYLIDSDVVPGVHHIRVPLPTFDEEIYSCWFVSPEAADELSATRFVSVTGWPDRFDEFVLERRYQNGINAIKSLGDLLHFWRSSDTVICENPWK